MNRQKFFISSCSCVTDCEQPCVPWLSVFQQLVKVTVCLERTKACGKLLPLIFVFLFLLLLIIWYLVFCKLLHWPEYKTKKKSNLSDPAYDYYLCDFFIHIFRALLEGARDLRIPSLNDWNFFLSSSFVKVKHAILPLKYNIVCSHTLLSGSWSGHSHFLRLLWLLIMTSVTVVIRSYVTSYVSAVKTSGDASELFSFVRNLFPLWQKHVTQDVRNSWRWKCID